MVISCFRGLLYSYVLLVAACCLLNCSALSAQQDPRGEKGLVFRLPVQAIRFATDKLGQSYILVAPNELILYNNRGKEFFRYNNNTLGPLHLIDTTDPFSILLFYQNFSTVITLDRTLTKTGEFNLLDLNIFDVNAVGASNDNNIWLYDPVAFKLKKISKAGEVIRESDPLSLVIDVPLEVNFILERNNQVFLNDPERGIYVFDLYGRYLRKLELTGLDRFQIIDDRLIYQKGTALWAFHLKTLRSESLLLPVKVESGDQLFLQRDRLYIVGKDAVKLFDLSR